MGRGIKKKALRFFLALFLVFLVCKILPYNVRADTSGVFCSGGKVFCTSGQFATCSDSLYRTKCLPGFPESFPVCCSDIGAGFQCSNNYLLCVSSLTSSSSSSSSSSGAFCSGGKVFCTSGQYAACLDQSYNLKCLSAYPFDFPECCEVMNDVMRCQTELLVCTSVDPSSRSTASSSSSGSLYISSSSSSGVAAGLAPAVSSSSGVVPGLAPAGSSSSGVVAGLAPASSSGVVAVLAPASGGNGGVIELSPDENMLSPPIQFFEESPNVGAGLAPALSQDKFQKITIDVLKNPELPDIVKPSLGIDELTTNKGIAYIGSNPSFEIKLPFGSSDLNPISVDLKDSNGKIFSNIPFNILPIRESFILTLTLPDEVSKGDSRFALNLSDGSSFIGLIQVIDFLKTSVPAKKNLREVVKPVISRLKTKKERQKLFIFLRGKDFVGKKFFYIVDDTTKILQTDSSNTFITIFPSGLKIDLKQKIVSKKGKRMKIKLKMKKVKELTNAVLVISTPRGITSKSFIIKPR